MTAEMENQLNVYHTYSLGDTEAYALSLKSGVAFLLIKKMPFEMLERRLFVCRLLRVCGVYPLYGLLQTPCHQLPVVIHGFSVLLHYSVTQSRLGSRSRWNMSGHSLI